MLAFLVFAPTSTLMVTKRTDPGLWERVKRSVTKGDKGGEPGQWSARKAQLAVQEYKKKGGGFVGRKSADNSLAKWTREDRTATSKGRETTAAREGLEALGRDDLLRRAKAKGLTGLSRLRKAELVAKLRG